MKLTIPQMAEAFELRGRMHVCDIAKHFGVSRQTMARYFRIAEQYGFQAWAGDLVA